jgi:hypothetical protein
MAQFHLSHLITFKRKPKGIVVGIHAIFNLHHVLMKFNDEEEYIYCNNIGEWGHSTPCHDGGHD